jgi:hypothetical protein
LRDGAGQFQVLALVIADRNLLGAVQQDVGGHQHRVGQQRRPDGTAPGGLLLELDHALQLTDVHGGLQQPQQLSVGRNLALHEDGAPLRVQAGRQQDAGLLQGQGPDLGRIVLRGERVQVGDAVEAADLALVGRPGEHRAEQVSQGEVPGGNHE